MSSDQVMGSYGFNIEQILMVDIIPDSSVRRAMNEINAGTNPLEFSYSFVEMNIEGYAILAC